jgi:hypothetical protein
LSCGGIRSFLILFFRKEERIFFSEEKKQKTFMSADSSFGANTQRQTRLLAGHNGQ